MIAFANPLFLGLWLMRATNDNSFDPKTMGTTFLEIKENYMLSLYSKYNDGIIGKTYKRIGYIHEPPKRDIKHINMYFTKKSISSYSILGFEIPESAKTLYTYERPKSFIIKREGNTLVIQNKKNKMFYIFDLYIQETQTPPIETRWNNFLFIQLVSFILNICLVQTFHIIQQG
jgi:hypothetical protein